MNIQRLIAVSLSLVIVNLLAIKPAVGQDKIPPVRLAKLTIDSSRVGEYQLVLKEEIEASIRLEPGVLTLYAVSEKQKPDHFTILEIYADSAAYRAHLQTPHFIKYKAAANELVKSLELVETVPLIPDMKIKEDLTVRKRKRKS